MLDAKIRRFAVGDDSIFRINSSVAVKLMALARSGKAAALPHLGSTAKAPRATALGRRFVLCPTGWMSRLRRREPHRTGHRFEYVGFRLRRCRASRGERKLVRPEGFEPPTLGLRSRRTEDQRVGQGLVSRGRSRREP